MPREQRTSVQIDEGRLTVAVDDTATVTAATPQYGEPLGKGGEHATLRAVGDGFEAAVRLDGHALDELVRELAAAAPTVDVVEAETDANNDATRGP